MVVYQLDRMSQDLSRENILNIILPALVISAIVSIILALGIGLYSSRKYAVPIYKLEQWLSLLMKGKVGATLQFREKEEMKDLSDKCNRLGSELHSIFQKVNDSVETLKRNNTSPEIIQNFENILSRIDLDADPIEVSTTYCKIIRDDEDNPKES